MRTQSGANEHQVLEWKESWRDEHLKWICGFANAQGGMLVTDKYLKACTEHRIPMPVMRLDFSGFWLEFLLRHDAGELTGKTPGKTPGKTVDLVLDLLRRDGTLAIPDISEQLCRYESAILRVISKLQNSGKVKRAGSRKGGHWQVEEENQR